MKQILIAKNERIKKLYGSEVELSGDKDFSFTKDVLTIAYFNLNLTPVSGKGTFSINYKPSEEIAQHGVSLVSAFESDGLVRAYFVALKDSVSLPKGTPILIATLFEPVSYRQVDLKVAQGVVNVEKTEQSQAVAIEQPKKRGGRKKKN